MSGLRTSTCTSEPGFESKETIAREPGGGAGRLYDSGDDGEHELTIDNAAWWNLSTAARGRRRASRSVRRPAPQRECRAGKSRDGGAEGCGAVVTDDGKDIPTAA